MPHELKTREYAVKMYRNCGDINYVCRKYHISRVSLWRWNKKYDGTKESITDKSHKPKSKHPNAHTNQEIRYIMPICPEIVITIMYITKNLLTSIKNAFGGEDNEPQEVGLAKQRETISSYPSIIW